MSKTTEEKLGMADLVIRVNLDFEIFDFSDTKEAITKGKTATEKELVRINKLLTSERNFCGKIIHKLGRNKRIYLNIDYK